MRLVLTIIFPNFFNSIQACNCHNLGSIKNDYKYTEVVIATRVLGILDPIIPIDNIYKHEKRNHFKE